MKLLGTPSAAAKQQDMDTEATLLSFRHDTSEAISCGKVHFRVRQPLEDKFVGMITEARASGTFRSGQAAKLFGTANFFEMALLARSGDRG